MSSGAPNEAVLQELLRIRDRATAYCLVILRDFQAAEDAYQEAAMTVLRRAADADEAFAESNEVVITTP